MKKLILSFNMFLLLVFILLATQIGPQPNMNNAYTEIFEVVNIYSPCCKDIIFELNGDKYLNYINRGIEKGIDQYEWNNHLKNEELIFTFIKNKSLLGPKHRT